MSAPRSAALSLLTLLQAIPMAAATIQVTATVDDNTANSNCTLREAIVAAQSDAAVDLCAAGAGPDVVQVPAGTYPWDLGQVFQSSNGGALVLRGPATTPPTAIVDIDPVASQRFMRLLNGADVTLEYLDLRNGDVTLNQSSKAGGALLAQDLVDVALVLRNVTLQGNRAVIGGGLYFETTSESPATSRLLIERSLIQANVATDTGGPRGGGLFVQVRGGTTARIVDSEILLNRAESAVAGTQVYAGGLGAGTSDQSLFELRRSLVGYNEADAGSGANPFGAGAYLTPAGDSTMRIEDVRFEGNNLIGAFVDAGNYVASALHVSTSFAGSLVLDRIAAVGNDPGEPAVDLRLQHFSTGSVVARDVLVARGAERGAQVSASGSDLALAHWTVTGHAGEGLRLERGGGALRLDNSLLWGNGADLVQSGGPTIDPSCLVGVDPLFVDAGADDYRLSALSPAVDFGDRTLASTGPLDAAHAPRVAGLDTDAGAFERDALFADDFESADAGSWSSSTP